MTIARTLSVAAEQAARANTPTPANHLPARSSRTGALLGCGLLAGPMYLIVFFAQALTRDGFDLLRHPATLLSTGSLGWIQITNFLITGALTVAAGIGMRRALPPSRVRALGWIAALTSRLRAGGSL